MRHQSVSKESVPLSDEVRRRLKRVPWCGVAVVLVVLSPGHAFAATQANPSDTTVKEHVEQHLESQHLRDVGNYQITVANHTITLTGEVPTLNTIRRVQQAVRKADETLGIDNRLTVTPWTGTDEELAGEVRKSIVTYAFFDIFDWVSGTVENGTVHLTGEVREPWRRNDYEYRVADIPGVRAIENTIRELPLSRYDDEVRVSAARAIYRNPHFLKYAYRANPPIHIVVENGTVRLEGRVLNGFESQLAESAVRNDVLSFTVTNNLETDLKVGSGPGKEVEK